MGIEKKFSDSKGTHVRCTISRKLNYPRLTGIYYILQLCLFLDIFTSLVHYNINLGDV